MILNPPYSNLHLFRTPLHAAAFAGHVECVQLLLGHGAPVDDVDQSGRSALMMAAEKGAIGAVGMEQFPLRTSLSLTMRSRSGRL